MIGGWRTALRVARRDAARHRGASLLALTLLVLPVLAVSTAAVLFMTQRVDAGEAPERRLGAAAALIEIEEGAARVAQAPDPEDGHGWSGDDSANDTTLQDVRQVLGTERDYLSIDAAEFEFATDKGWSPMEATELDLASPLVDGLVRHSEGKAVPAGGEVVVNRALADRGPEVGEFLQIRDTHGADIVTELRIVGITESARFRDWPMAWVVPGELGLSEAAPVSYLVGGGPVTWDDVMHLNQRGVLVTSRSVLGDPPAPEELPVDYQFSLGESDDALLAVVGLIAVMVLIEVVLLAGPSFAVGARRQAHTLALVAANGGTARQLRRTVLASGIVLGGLGAVVGVSGGIGLAWLLQPLLQRFSSTWFGPFEVPWLVLVAVAGFGVLSALLAAIVPAVVASRRNVVDVLAGRRGDGRPSRGAPVVGLVVLGIGIAVAVAGTRPGGPMLFGMSENLIAVAAIVCVLGMVLLIPVAVTVVGRLVARAPLPVRFAGRDAARHRSRTVPAVAAVAATVAGVTALGIATASDQAEREGTYTQLRPLGEGIVTDWGEDADWAAYVALVREQAPGVEVTRVRGMREVEVDGHVSFGPRGSEGFWVNSTSCCGASLLVGTEFPDVLPGVSEADRRAADAVLAEGGVVVFARPGEDADAVDVRFESWSEGADEPAVTGRMGDVPVHLIEVDVSTDAVGEAPAQAVISPGVAQELGVPVGVVSLVLGEGLSRDAEQDLQEALAALSSEVDVYVERGYQPDGALVIVQLILFGLGGVLMLGGTLTATFLALADARPDLATMAAVGARPRTRRAVAASYALVVALVGSVLGALVGAIPGWAVTYPLTAESWHGSGPYLDIPWLLIGGVVLGLPLLTAAIVGLFARSRLPMVARME